MDALTRPISEHLTPAPYAVGPKEPLVNAGRLMDKYGLRELPVRAEGRLVGLLSDRDLRVVSALTPAPPETLTVDAVMSRDPCTAALDTPLLEVVRAMADRSADVVVVLDAGRVAGVFTSLEAIRVLSGALERTLARPDERVRSARHGHEPRRATRGRAAR